MITPYRILLRTAGFPRVLLSSLVGRLPSGMLSLSLLLFVHARTGSFLSAGAVVGTFTLAGALASPLQGALVDRLGQTRVLLPCAVVQGALLVGFVPAADAGLGEAGMIGWATVAGAFLPPVSGCVRALWPMLATDQQTLERIYALDAISQEAIYTLGPLLAGTVAVLVSPGASVLLCAAIALAGTALFASCPASRGARGAQRGPWRGGALRSSALRLLLLSALLGGMVVGAAEVGLPALAAHLRSRGSAGALLALFSVGSMLGGLLYSARGSQAPPARRYPLLLLGVALSFAPLIAARSLVLAYPLSLVAGLGVAPMLACQFSLVGAFAPEGTATEAFTWHRGTTVAGIALGTAVGGSLVDRTAVGAAFVLGCAAALSAWGIAAGASGGRPRRPSWRARARAADRA